MNRSVWARGRGLRWVAAVFAALAGMGSAAAEEAAVSAVDSGDTAWMLTSMALALFYGGLVRTKNVLSVLMQCLVITCVVTVMWAVAGYSLTFSTAGMAPGAVTLNAGIAALVCAVMLVKRQGYPEVQMAPHSLTLAVVGTSMLWSGAVSVVLLKVLDATVGLRVKPQEEMDGLDITRHNGQGYNY